MASPPRHGCPANMTFDTWWWEAGTVKLASALRQRFCGLHRAAFVPEQAITGKTRQDDAGANALDRRRNPCVPVRAGGFGVSVRHRRFLRGQMTLQMACNVGHHADAGRRSKYIKFRQINAFVGFKAGSPTGTLTTFVAPAPAMVQSTCNFFVRKPVKRTP